jgi:hypothetical protein
MLSHAWVTEKLRLLPPDASFAQRLTARLALSCPFTFLCGVPNAIQR